MKQLTLLILAVFLVACGQPKTPTIQAADFIQIQKGRCDQIGDNKVANGKVVNTGNVEFKFVQLRVTIYRDDITQPLGNKISYIDSDTLPPGGSSTYKIYIPDPGDDAYNCKVELESVKY